MPFFSHSTLSTTHTLINKYVGQFIGITMRVVEANGMKAL